MSIKISRPTGGVDVADLDAAIDARKGITSGIAPLDVNQKIPAENMPPYVPLNVNEKIDSIYLPSLDLFQIEEPADEAARLALTQVAVPMLAVQADNGSSWIIEADADPSIAGNWISIGTQAVSSVDGLTGAVVLTSKYASLVDGLIDVNQMPAEALLTADALELFPSKTGDNVATTAKVATITSNNVDLDFSTAAVVHVFLDQNVNTLQLLNAPAEGVLGLLEVWFHQAATGGPWTVNTTALEALADDWGIDGAPTGMPSTADAVLVVQFRRDHGRATPKTYGEWSTPDVRYVTVPLSDPNGTSPEAGTGKAWWPVPAGLNGYRVTAVQADQTTAGSNPNGTTTVQVHKVPVVGSPVDILGTVASIDAAEKSSSTAATPPAISAANATLATGDQLRFDLPLVGTGSEGHFCTLTLTGPPK